MANTANMAANEASAAPAYNLVGQKLGRKGLETRERIMSAMLSLLERDEEGQVTLTAVAREASVGMTTLYLYFPDIGELLLAVLARVIDSAGAAYLGTLRERWSDEELERSAFAFIDAHHRFWNRNARVLHLRNAMAEAKDQRFLDVRKQQSVPVVELLVAQMADSNGAGDEQTRVLATILVMGLERIGSVATNPVMFEHVEPAPLSSDPSHLHALIRGEARILTLTIRDERARLRALSR